MAWNNGRLVLYHGCDNISADNIMRIGVKLNLCDPLTDFAQGFYTTTYLEQAKNWANVRCLELLAPPNPQAVYAVVLGFQLDRAQLAELDILGFVTEGSNSDYWDFVKFCRGGGGNTSGHMLTRVGPSGPRYTHYGAVFGPVSLWPQTLVIKDCDQISFHNSPALQILQGMQPPYRIQRVARADLLPTNPLF